MKFFMHATRRMMWKLARSEQLSIVRVLGGLKKKRLESVSRAEVGRGLGCNKDCCD